MISSSIPLSLKVVKVGLNLVLLKILFLLTSFLFQFFLFFFACSALSLTTFLGVVLLRSSIVLCFHFFVFVLFLDVYDPLPYEAPTYNDDGSIVLHAVLVVDFGITRMENLATS